MILYDFTSLWVKFNWTFLHIHTHLRQLYTLFTNWLFSIVLFYVTDVRNSADLYFSCVITIVL